MNNQLAIREEVNFEAILKDVEVMQNMCANLMKTKHYQTMGEAGLFAIVQKAKSLNIHPLEALNGGLYFVQGKVGMSSEMMASLIRQQGHSIVKDPRSDNSICILNGKRADNGDTWTVSFSLEDAKRAGLLKNLYDKYPGVMLYNRAMSMLARQLFPDVIKGAGYTHDELVEIKNNNNSNNFNHVEPAKLITVVETINEDQTSELIQILSECDEDYVESVMKFIRKPPVSVNKLSDLPASLFDRVKSAAIKKRDEARERELESIETQQVAMGEE